MTPDQAPADAVCLLGWTKKMTTLEPKPAIIAAFDKESTKSRRASIATVAMTA